MPHSQALTAQPKPETEILAKAGSKLDREKIALKMRLNEPLSPAEVAFWMGVEPKTVTQEWIKRRGLGATKTGSRTIRIEPNALRCWLIDNRIQVRGHAK